MELWLPNLPKALLPTLKCTMAASLETATCINLYALSSRFTYLVTNGVTSTSGGKITASIA